ncbi:MAG: ATP-binding cassette domain-containing protein [Anaerolineae bacterium]
MNSVPALEISHLSMRHGQTPLLTDVSLTVWQGEIHAVLGAEGSGRVTLFRILAGIQRAGFYTGEIRVADHPVVIHDVQDAMRSGISAISRRSGIFPGLSVAENIMVGRWQRYGRSFLISQKAMEREAEAVLGELELKLNPAQPAGQLTAGQQRLVTIARALASHPKVIVLDEPAAMLKTAGEQSHLIRVLRLLAGRDIGLLYLARRPVEATRIADRITVLRDGCINGSWSRAAFDELTLTQAMISQREGGEDYEQEDEDEGPRNLLDALRAWFRP